MARELLTDRKLRSLKPAPAGTRYEVMDAMVPGLGVRVTDKADASGQAKRTFMLVARFPGSPNPTRRALGQYGKLTLDQARDKAREWHACIQNGIDPQQAETRRRTTEQERQAITFGVMAQDFIARHLEGKRRAAADEREIRRELISRWGDMPVSEITRRDVVAMVDSIVDRSAKRQAHNILGHARTIFNWAINRGIYGIEASPCDRLKPAQLIGVKNHRQRVLSDGEIAALWRATGPGGLGYPVGDLCRMLLLTGQRRSEVAEARWSEFDLEKRVWVIPVERFKSRSTHLVPLTEGVVRLLVGLPRFTSGEFLFTTTAGQKPVNGFSKAKARLDRLIAGEFGSAPAPWVFHDIRRTVRTRLSGLRVPETVAELVIGHGKRGLARVYDQHSYLDEKREALSAWEARLGAIVASPPGIELGLRERP